MEKGKKTVKENAKKQFKKKSFAYLSSTILTTNPSRSIVKHKDLLQETNTSWKKNSLHQRNGTSCPKKTQKQPQKGDSLASLTMTNNHNFNCRNLTEIITSKHSSSNLSANLKKRKLLALTEFRENTCKDKSKTKERLSLNDAPKKLAVESKINTETIPIDSSFSMSELQMMQDDIKKQVQRSCSKAKINKKDLLKITGKYDRLISRIVVFDTLDPNKCNKEQKRQVSQDNLNKQQNCKPKQQIQLETFNEIENIAPISKAKAKILPNLQLQDVKKLKIADYADEFMSHYEQLSESWQRDINNQKRY